MISKTLFIYLFIIIIIKKTFFSSFNSFINFSRLIKTIYYGLIYFFSRKSNSDLFVGKRHYLPEGKVKHYMYQLLKSVDHMHR